MNSQEIIRQRMVEGGILEAENVELLLQNHPVPVVEIPSLASVASPSFTYKLILPAETINSGALSILQLESVIHACQRHQQRLPNRSRAGFLVGDGAGVGKGRIAAGIIYENFLRGRKKSIWLSVSNELKNDVKRDLRDIGAEKIAVHHLHTFQSSLTSRDVFGSIKDGVIFSTFSSLTTFSNFHRRYKPYLEELLYWCGQEFDGVVILEEFNQSIKQLYNVMRTPAMIESTVLELQRRLPNARIVYICATGISIPHNMSYMTRLGLWGEGTPFSEFEHFTKAFEEVGCMELVGMEMKQRGMYLARQLSFQDVPCSILEVFLDRRFIEMYNNSVRMWIEVQRFFMEAEERQTINQDAHQTLWFNFWAAHFDFFKHLCISAKVLDAVLIAKRAVRKGKSVVIGLQTTDEALSNVVSTAKEVLVELVRNHFPFPSVNCYRPPVYESVGEKRKYAFYEADRMCKRKKTDSSYIEVGNLEVERTRHRIQNFLLENINRLPGNWIDQLIDELGGPQKVAEISNRKERAVVNSDGKIRYELRSENDVPLDKINMRERELFMRGKKNIVIITKIAGISLQEDQRVNNRRPRVYISLECPSQPDLAIQQFGCVHRTGHSKQVSPPEFICLFSVLAGEMHLAPNIAKKLESLGGNDRSDLSALDTVDANLFVYSEHGRNALDSTMKSILGYTEPLVPPPRDYPRYFFKDVTKALAKIEFVWNFHEHSPRLPSYNTSVPEFLRRIVGIPVELQTRLFQYFIDTLSITIRHAMITPYFNGMGITEIGVDQIVQLKKLPIQLPVGPAKVQLHRFEIDRGVSWTVAVEKWSFITGTHEGFYTSKIAKSIIVLLVVQNGNPRADKEDFLVIHPNTGFQFLPVSLDDLKKLQKISPFEAKPIWMDCYQSSMNDCSSVQLCGARKDDVFNCYHGLRRWNCSILSGPLLSVWNKVKSALKGKASLKVGCVHFKDVWIFGLIIPLDVELRIIDLLFEHYERLSS